jgi:Cu(I)/Ag(I) efflux system membrane protein CusA/SilA
MGTKLLREAAKEVTPALFFSLLIIAVSFLPIFGLNGQAGRLFKPLAYTKTFVMLSAALLSVTFAPAIRDMLRQGRITSEGEHPISRLIQRVYAPFVYVALRRPVATLAIGVLAIASAVPLFLKLGTEFMPALNEGDLLYMPTTLPNISVEEAKRQLELQDRALASLPEVIRVFGKVGRAETPTDPAPLSMVETIVQLRPASVWPTVHRNRWYSEWSPRWAKAALARMWPEDRPESWDELIAKLNALLRQPGWTNAFTMPIKTRIDMLSTGMRTPVGVKIFGSDLESIELAGAKLEALLRRVPGTRSVLYERSLGGAYVDVIPDRDAIARYGLQVDDVDTVVEGAIGGEPVTVSVQGRRRYTVNVRYKPDFRSSPNMLREVPVPLRGGGRGTAGARTIPLGELADVRIVEGPPMLRDEAGMLVGYVYIDTEPWRDLGGYVRDVTEVAIVFLSVPFALVGSVWLLYLLDYRLSTAVWVGVIALVGLAAQTGVVMIVYIDHAFAKRVREGRIRGLEDIIEAHTEGTVQRVRPKLMTVSTMLLGLLPLLWATGSGADVMKRIAAPMVGGLLSSAFLTLELIPVIYTYWRYAQLRRAKRTGRTVAEVCGIER